MRFDEGVGVEYNRVVDISSRMIGGGSEVRFHKWVDIEFIQLTTPYFSCLPSFVPSQDAVLSSLRTAKSRGAADLLDLRFRDELRIEMRYPLVEHIPAAAIISGFANDEYI